MLLWKGGSNSKGVRKDHIESLKERFYDPKSWMSHKKVSCDRLHAIKFYTIKAICYHQWFWQLFNCAIFQESLKLFLSLFPLSLHILLETVPSRKPLPTGMMPPLPIHFSQEILSTLDLWSYSVADSPSLFV